VCLEWSIISIENPYESPLPHHQASVSAPSGSCLPKHEEEATDDIREKGERG